ncbi:MAG: bifunctional 4'-phosphopantothenoylcysteine decarboxylase/phosphopantothenoylcysteine synthetase, partial [Gammaproteobacteria bacterium]|nr:bifunctional 4'-phosphopantothenoylcysteine decarboxylase/phosphopantothenoylcysteine synthetase [Gammaproteobacteria bacterium]
MNVMAKHIVIGVSGGIAAYKSPDLVRRFRDQGADVRVVLTAGGRQFVTPLALQAVAGQPVYTSLFESAGTGMEHIELARWADAVVIAPASADILAKLAHGLADDLLSTLCLATTAPLWVAPAMNRQMWQAVAVQANVASLRARGVQFIGPASGVQ